MKEQRPRSLVFESVGAPETVLLRYSGDGKRLTRESAGQDIMIGDTFAGREIRDVVFRRLTKPGVIRLPSVGIDLAGEQTPAAHGLQADAQTADSGEEINEGEARI